MPENTTLSVTQGHPLMHQRVRITDGHPDHVGRVGVLVKTETMATGETQYTVWGNGQAGYLVTGIEPLVPDRLVDLCDRITEKDLSVARPYLSEQEEPPCAALLRHRKLRLLPPWPPLRPHLPRPGPQPDAAPR